MQINQMLKIPIISMECTVPTPNMSEEQVQYFRNLKGDINVYLTEYSKLQWEEYTGIVIPHGIDTGTFKPRDAVYGISIHTTVVAVANSFRERDYCLNYQGWERVTQGLPVHVPIKVLGKNPGLSEPAGSIDELVSEYQNARVFFNSSTFSPIPTSLLEAMACGCPVVSMATCGIPDVIENGVNGFISNDEKELREYLEQLLTDNELCARIGSAGRKTIEERFGMEQFVNNWNSVFTQAANMEKL
jgi:glycosyltransferase involved in cell wall biosynthesis